MQTASMSMLARRVLQFSKRIPVLILTGLVLLQSAVADDPEPMFSSVVLVLKLVSATHVKPTTGIVISDDGMVLVSADFISGQGEILVLDGGTDILSNGRPAKIINKGVAGGLAILSVEGLDRPAIILSDSTPNTDSQLHLAAFPPAEFIAKGAEPLWQPVSILKHTQYGRLSVSPNTALPNVTGAIIDACGYLTGLNLSVGVQSLQPGINPTVMFAEELNLELDSLQLELPRADCSPKAIQAVVTKSPEQTNDQANDQLSEDTEAEIQTTEPDENRAIATELVEAPVEQVVADANQGIVNKPTTHSTLDHTAPASLWRSIPFWIPLLGIIVLFVLIWKLRFYFKLDKPEIKQAARTQDVNRAQPASDEPDTAPLQTDSDSGTAHPRSAPKNDLSLPNLDARPEGCDSLLLIEGKLDADSDFKRFCFVNRQQINVVIGRGEADINIEHPAISRRHALIEADSENMTLSDQGSRNGTFINSVPCLSGEVMFLEPGDEVYLGDVHFKIRLVTQEAEWA
jgi:hypothetical protein